MTNENKIGCGKEIEVWEEGFFIGKCSCGEIHKGQTRLCPECQSKEGCGKSIVGDVKYILCGDKTKFGKIVLCPECQSQQSTSTLPFGDETADTSKSQFNLKEKRKELFLKIAGKRFNLSDLFDKIDKQDKEFIRRLKEELKGPYRNKYHDEFELIDKLSGGL
jgi:hypothetical protein